VLFKNENGKDSEAQIAAFGDTWHWDLAAENTYRELITDAPEQVSRMIGALRDFIGANQLFWQGFTTPPAGIKIIRKFKLKSQIITYTSISSLG